MSNPKCCVHFDLMTYPSLSNTWWQWSTSREAGVLLDIPGFTLFSNLRNLIVRYRPGILEGGVLHHIKHQSAAADKLPRPVRAVVRPIHTSLHVKAHYASM